MKIDSYFVKKKKKKCVSLLRKAKKYYFASLNKNHITENKCFWKTVKPFLSNKL